MINEIVDHVFQSLYGRPCWNAKSGFGSFMTMEFGDPCLTIREPRQVKDSDPPAVQGSSARRHVWVSGQWHLWIYCCEWEVRTGKKRIGHSNLKGSSKRPIERAARELDGQKLLHVSINPQDSSSVFEFDLGSRLETQPYDETSKQWILRQPNNFYFSLRADSHFSHHPGDTPYGAETWHPLVATVEQSPSYFLS